MYRVLAGDVSASVTGGETITTDPGGVGASTDVPLQTQIVVPNGVAGTISGHAPAVRRAAGRVRAVQQAGSAERSGLHPGTTTPYAVTFTVDASELGPVSPSRGASVPQRRARPRLHEPDRRAAEPVRRVTRGRARRLGRRGGHGAHDAVQYVDARPARVPGHRGQPERACARRRRTRLITVTGDGFLAGVKAKFSGTGVTVNSTTLTSATSLTLDVTVSGTATTGARDVIITNPGNATATCTACFAVNAKPTIVGTSPSALPVGASHAVTLTGTGFENGAVVSFAGTGVSVDSVTFVDAAHLTLVISVAPGATTGARSATVTNPDGGTVTKSAALTVNALPTVTSTTPSLVKQGQTTNVVIVGSGYAANFTTAGGVVSFGPGITINTLTRTSATKLTANVTVAADATAGPVELSVTNPDGGSAICAVCLEVIATPHISSVSPGARGQGTAQQVTVTGDGFQDGATAKFSGTGVTVGAVTWNSDTSITLTVTVVRRRDDRRPQPHHHQPRYRHRDLHGVLHREREADDHLGDAERTSPGRGASDRRRGRNRLRAGQHGVVLGDGHHRGDHRRDCRPASRSTSRWRPTRRRGAATSPSRTPTAAP